MKKIYIILLSLFLFQYGIGQNTINGYEYWFDNDYANKTSTNISPVAQFNFNQNISTSGLANGLHTFNFRAINQDGIWSSPLTHYFYKLPIVNNIANPSIVTYEYWLDNNYASAIQVNTLNQEQVNVNELISMSSLPVGLHQFNIRFKDENGLWSSPLTHTFYKLSIVNNITNPSIVTYEYWLDNNYASAIQVNTPNQEQVNVNDLISMSSVVNGLHQFNIRFKDENGLWSSPLTHVFYKLENNVVVMNPLIKTYRYWFDDDFTNVQTIDLTDLQETYQWNELLPMPANMTGGQHAINVQFKDSIGLWSSPLEHEFEKNFDPRGEILLNSNSFCGISTITFSTFTVDVDSIYWDFGDGSEVIGSLAANNVNHLYNTIGEYEVTCTLKHLSSGISNNISSTIFIYPIYENLPTEFVSVCESELPYIFGSQLINQDGIYEETFQTIHGCDSVVTLDFHIKYPSNNVDIKTACGSYTWIDGVTYTSSINTPTYTFIGGAANGCDSIVTLNLTINPFPSSEVLVNGITLIASENGAIYQWINCDDNQPIYGETNQTFTATENGNYAVIITKNDCEIISECNAITTVGMEEWNINSIVVYPNPNDGKFTLDLGDFYEKVDVVIMNMQGAIIYHSKENSISELNINIDIANGIYILKLNNQNFERTVKFMVNK